MSGTTDNSQVIPSPLVQDPKQHFSDIIVEVNRKLSSGMSYQKVLDFIFDALAFLIPFDRIGIALVEGEGDRAQLSSKWVRSKVSVEHLNLSYSASVQGSSLQKIMETGESRIINDLLEYSISHPNSLSTKLVIRDGIRSSLTCPLRSENQQVGVVFFSSCKPNTYSGAHIQIFRDIADELSVIVNNGRLRYDFEALSSQAKSLNMTLHDLKSPLSVIQGFAEASLEEAWFQKLDPEGKHVFEIFLRNTKYMFELLNELLEIGQLNQHADLFTSEEVDLREFCLEMATLGKIITEYKNIVFNVKISPEIPNQARFSPSRIERVLDNLFSNAAKYSMRGSEVDFAVRYENGHLEFSVCDHGLGIPESEKPKLFREFSKTSVRPTEGETSTGLGLAIAKKIVEQHEGEISVSSEVDKGSTFRFWIPLTDTTNVH